MHQKKYQILQLQWFNIQKKIQEEKETFLKEKEQRKRKRLEKTNESKEKTKTSLMKKIKPKITLPIVRIMMEIMIYNVQQLRSVVISVLGGFIEYV